MFRFLDDIGKMSYFSYCTPNLLGLEEEYEGDPMPVFISGNFNIFRPIKIDIFGTYVIFAKTLLRTPITKAGIMIRLIKPSDDET